MGCCFSIFKRQPKKPYQYVLTSKGSRSGTVGFHDREDDAADFTDRGTSLLDGSKNNHSRLTKIPL